MRPMRLLNIQPSILLCSALCSWLTLTVAPANAAPLLYDVTVTQIADTTGETSFKGFSINFSDGQNALGARPLFAVLGNTLTNQSINLDTGATTSGAMTDNFVTTLTVLDSSASDTFTLTAVNPDTVGPTSGNAYLTFDRTFPGSSAASLSFTIPAGGFISSPLIYVVDQPDNGGYILGNFQISVAPAVSAVPELSPGSLGLPLALCLGSLALLTDRRRRGPI
jgi:hypothetical protein